MEELLRKIRKLFTSENEYLGNNEMILFLLYFTSISLFHTKLFIYVIYKQSLFIIISLIYTSNFVTLGLLAV